MPADTPGPVILIHGGAGKVAPDLAELRRAGVQRAALAGWQVLSRGGSAVEAVECAVRVLEDDPAFNAGRGACLNRDGEVELDASIMDGRSLAAGAIGAVQRIANPVTLARAVMDSPRPARTCASSCHPRARGDGRRPTYPAGGRGGAALRGRGRDQRVRSRDADR